ncbi:DUF6551 family protein [Terrihabitans rhizophilus]|uniref:DUF6551 family protein n=1 Tax=Terrihabitans rhizophilus TaxID=3092662 RepID=A0ABU4RNC8_9HYPH|nr:DUF6551 family protein [Terrihabitans sp. PJ23]MDX6806345.1 DUF6551 family protein [Terrihabitans sp. PJ23]
MSALRPIAAVSAATIEPGVIGGAKPIFEWVEPASLLVDETYQRNLSEKSIRLIRRIVAGWDWNRFKPPVAVITDNGLELIDGQHTSIAAATHPDVHQIPVMIVEAADRADRAAAFLGHNRDRLNVTAPQMHVAAVTAGENHAVAVDRICRAIGIEVLRTQPKTFRPRQTIAVSAITALVKARSEEIAVRVLVVLANALVAPIRGDQVKAVDLLLTDEQFAPEIAEDKLTEVIRGMGVEAADQEAKTFAATHKVPVWRALASVWFRDRNKRWPKGNVEPPKGEAITALPSPSPTRPTTRPVTIPDDIKKDMREELPAAGWRSGVHIRRCSKCDSRFHGHPTATTCADCAYEGAEV